MYYDENVRSQFSSISVHILAKIKDVLWWSKICQKHYRASSGLFCVRRVKRAALQRAISQIVHPLSSSEKKFRTKKRYSFVLKRMSTFFLLKLTRIFFCKLISIQKVYILYRKITSLRFSYPFNWFK